MPYRYFLPMMPLWLLCTATCFRALYGERQGVFSNMLGDATTTHATRVPITHG
jgi:hypothetical protein